MTLRDKPATMRDASLEHLSVSGPGAISPSYTAIAQYGDRELQPNRGIPLNLDWIAAVPVNTSAVERRAQTLVTRRSVEKDLQSLWLLRTMQCMELTTLSVDD